MKNKTSFDAFLEKYISEEWSLLAAKYITSKKYSKNTNILTEGEKVKGVCFINNGMVKVVSHYDPDNERLLRLSGNGDLLGHRAISSTHYPISAIALVDSEVSFIPIEIFNKLIKNNPDFAFYLIDFLASELKSTEDHMKSMIHNEVIIRIGKIFCMLIDAYGFDSNDSRKLYYSLSRSDIASFAGTSYETVIRNLAKLEEMKIIQLEKKSIIILKEKDLRKLTSSVSHS